MTVTIYSPKQKSADSMRRIVEATVQDKIFSAEFVKADGTVRKMNARLSVKKHLKGGKSCNTKDNLLTVYDLKSKGYRNINMNTLKSLTVDKIKHVFDDEWNAA
jgi:hypothetical protein|tara:strand:+ start:192 stop:503 length:312 start_codon:yes stop_codon:yes gene_type:complete